MTLTFARAPQSCTRTRACNSQVRRRRGSRAKALALARLIAEDLKVSQELYWRNDAAQQQSYQHEDLVAPMSTTGLGALSTFTPSTMIPEEPHQQAEPNRVLHTMTGMSLARSPLAISTCETSPAPSNLSSHDSPSHLPARSMAPSCPMRSQSMLTVPEPAKQAWLPSPLSPSSILFTPEQTPCSSPTAKPWIPGEQAPVKKLTAKDKKPAGLSVIASPLPPQKAMPTNPPTKSVSDSGNTMHLPSPTSPLQRRRCRTHPYPSHILNSHTDPSHQPIRSHTLPPTLTLPTTLSQTSSTTTLTISLPTKHCAIHLRTSLLQLTATARRGSTGNGGSMDGIRSYVFIPNDMVVVNIIPQPGSLAIVLKPRE